MSKTFPAPQTRAPLTKCARNKLSSTLPAGAGRLLVAAARYECGAVAPSRARGDEAFDTDRPSFAPERGQNAGKSPPCLPIRLGQNCNTALHTAELAARAFGVQA